MSEKTEDPTSRKLAKARTRGEVAVSAVTSQAIAFLVAVLVVPSTVTATAARASALLRRAFAGTLSAGSVSSIAGEVVLLVAPLLVAVAATSALATVVQTGAVFAPARIAPDLTRMDPIAGLRSLLSGARLWNVTRALLASVVLGDLAFRAVGQSEVDLAHAVGRAPVGGPLARHGAFLVAGDA